MLMFYCCIITFGISARIDIGLNYFELATMESYAATNVYLYSGSEYDYRYEYRTVVNEMVQSEVV